MERCPHVRAVLLVNEVGHFPTQRVEHWTCMLYEGHRGHHQWHVMSDEDLKKSD